MTKAKHVTKDWKDKEDLEKQVMDVALHRLGIQVVDTATHRQYVSDVVDAVVAKVDLAMAKEAPAAMLLVVATEMYCGLAEHLLELLMSEKSDRSSKKEQCA